MKQIFADMHCDTITTLYDQRMDGSCETLLCNSLQLDIQKMQTSGYLLQNFAVFLEKNKWENLYQEAMLRIDLFTEELDKTKDCIRQVTSYNQILQNKKEGKISALLSLEGGEILEGNVDNLFAFYIIGNFS